MKKLCVLALAAIVATGSLAISPASAKSGSTASAKSGSAASAKSGSAVAKSGARVAKSGARVAKSGSRVAKSRSSRLLKSNVTRVAATGRSNYAELIRTQAAANNVPLSLAHAVVTVESNYKPNLTGSVGEIGLMQVRLQTARGMGYKGTAKALYDPATNIRYGMMYLGQARKLAGGDLCGTILKYNGGHGATRMSKGPLRYCGKVQQIIASN